MIACAIAELTKRINKKVFLYQIKDNDGAPISKENIELLESFGIQVYDELIDYEDNPEMIFSENKNSRNQLEFMKNLMIKWKNEYQDEDIKKCYLCGCTIQEVIIASHIQRICDINKLYREKVITFEEARRRAVDGNNGFWLCANHDKMFEHGIITFNENTGELILNENNLTEEHISFIENMTVKYNIDKEHFTEELKGYLKIHNDRINNSKKL